MLKIHQSGIVLKRSQFPLKKEMINMQTGSQQSAADYLHFMIIMLVAESQFMKVKFDATSHITKNKTLALVIMKKSFYF